MTETLSWFYNTRPTSSVAITSTWTIFSQHWTDLWSTFVVRFPGGLCDRLSTWPLARSRSL